MRRRPANKKLKKNTKRRLPRYESLTARQKAIYDRTTSLISDLRGGNGSYRELLREYHLTSRTARTYGGRDLLGGNRKPVRASRSDKRVRDLLFPKSFGDIPVRTRSSKDATRLSEYYTDRRELLRDKLSARDFEHKWAGVRVAGQEVLADTQSIFRMANAGILKVETLYASVGFAE